MDVQIYGASFIFRENIDSRKRAYPYILYIYTGETRIIIFLEEHNYKKLKEELDQVFNSEIL